jgi:hypothetical protein
MKRAQQVWVVASATVLFVFVGGSSIVTASGGGAPVDDSERSIPGGALARAEQAALEVTGEGTVTETEVGDEESYYEVEVLLDDGHRVDVQLDEAFAPVGSAPDVEEAAAEN